MILGIHDQLIRPYIVRSSAVAALAVYRVLALIDVAVAKCHRDIFDTVEIHVVADGLPGHRTVQRMVEVVGPVRVQAETAAFGRMDEPRIIQVALRDEHDLAVAGIRKGVDGIRQFLQEVDGLETVDGADGIEPQSIEAIDLKPHSGIVEHELPDAVTVRAIVVDRIAPGRPDQVREVRSVVIQIITIGSEVVVDHIEQNGESLCMAGCDKSGEILGRAIGRLRRKQIDAVVTPAVLTRKGRKWHDFNMGHAKADKMRELLGGGGIGSLGL